MGGAFFEGDSGDGTVGKELFMEAMGKVGVKGEVLETALGQAAGVSLDLHHISYEEFLQVVREE